MKFLFLCFFQIIISFVLAQQFPTYKLNEENGLPSSDVYRVIQDHNGYIWLATDNGLCRYDGSKLKHYTTDNGLLSNSIIHLSEDDSNRLWACSYHGGFQYLQDENFKERKTDFGAWPKRLIKSVHTEQKDWGLTKTGLYYKYKDSIKNVLAPCLKTSYKDIERWGKDTIIVRTDSGIFLYLNNRWEPFLPNLLPKTIGAMYVGPRNNLWLAYSKGILCYQQNQLDTIIKYEFSSIPDQIVTDKLDRIWISNFQSLFLITNGSCSEITQKVDSKDLKINQMFVDNQNNLWLATYGSGAICIISDNFLNFPINNTSLSSPITGIACTDSMVLVASMGVISEFKKGEKLFPILTDYHTSKDFPYFIQVLDEEIIVGNPRQSFSLSKENNRIETRIMYAQPSRSLLKASWGDYFLGGFEKLEVDTGDGLNNAEPKIARRVNDLVEWDSSIILGTDSGLFQFQNGKEDCIYSHQNPMKNFINTVFVDSRNTLWVGTNNSCLTISKDDEGRMKQTIQEGIKSVKSIIEEENGTLWIASKTGLIRLKDGDISKFDRSHGLLSNEVNSVAIDSNRYLWAATSLGISRVRLNILNQFSKPSSIKITEISYDTSTFYFPKEVSLSTTNTNIHISFSNFHFPFNNQYTYQYQLNGLHDSWFNINEQTIQLNTLPEGVYTLVVRQVDTPKIGFGKLKLIVIAPFYQRKWFLICLFFIGLLLVGIITRYSTKKREQSKHQKLKQHLKVILFRTQALQAVISPHFLFNSLTSILSLVQTNKKEKVESYVFELSSLLRTVLERVDSSTISIENEIKNLNHYFQLEKVRFGQRLQFGIRFDSNVDQKTQIPNMLLQPFVENAIIHGISKKEEGGTITVHFQKEGCTIKITIEDDGVGFGTSNRTNKKSIGTKLIHQRLKLMEEISNKPFYLRIRKRSPTGTIVQIVISINDDALIIR